MNDLLTYNDENGQSVFTSTFLKNRGTCCKTNCLHCPYLFTLKNIKPEFTDVTLDQLPRANSILAKDETSELTSSLLGPAFGSKKKDPKVTAANIADYKFVTLKGVTCGVIRFDIGGKSLSESAGEKVIKELFLAEHFEHQGLDLDFIKSCQD